MFSKFFAGTFVSLFLVQLPNEVKSQINSNPDLGAHAVQYGIWSAINNPAGLAKENGFSTGFYYQSAFLMHQLADAGCVVAFPAGKFSVIGLSYRQFGYSLYKEQCAGFVLAKQLGKLVSAGIRFDYLNIAFGNDYGKSSIITGSAGVIIHVTGELRVGLYVFNPQRAEYSEYSNLKFPAMISAGLAWQFGTHADLSLGVEKNADSKEIISCGLDYKISSKFKLFAGVSNGNKPVYFGYAFRVGRIELSMSSGYHSLLGFSPQLLLTYKSKSNE